MKLNHLVDFVARGLDTTKTWTPLDIPLYLQSSYSQRRKSAQKPTEEVSPHNQAYLIPGKDYLIQ